LEHHDTQRILVARGASIGQNSFDGGAKETTEALAASCHKPVSDALVFASAQYNLYEMLRGGRGVAGDAPLIGATTADVAALLYGRRA
jgi:hypothetical protein